MAQSCFEDPRFGESINLDENDEFRQKQSEISAIISDAEDDN